MERLTKRKGEKLTNGAIVKERRSFPDSPIRVLCRVPTRVVSSHLVSGMFRLSVKFMGIGGREDGISVSIAWVKLNRLR